MANERAVTERRKPEITPGTEVIGAAVTLSKRDEQEIAADDELIERCERVGKKVSEMGHILDTPDVTSVQWATWLQNATTMSDVIRGLKLDIEDRMRIRRAREARAASVVRA